MYRLLLSFFACAILSLSFTTLKSAPPQDPQIEWFQSFFRKKTVPANTLIDDAEQRLAHAVDKKDKREESKIRQELGLIHLAQQHLYDTAMGYFIQALTIEDSLHLVEEQVFTYIGIARIFEEIHDYDKSANALEEALLLNEESGNVDLQVFIHNKLGRINSERGQFDAAFQNFEKMLDYKDDVSEPGAEAEALFQQGHLYTKLNDYGAALSIHKKALQLWRRDKNRLMEAQSLNDIGELYRLMKREDRVLANHKAALEIRESINDEVGMAQSHNNLAILYFEKEKYDSAIHHLQAAQVEGNESHAQEQLGKTYEYLALSYKAVGDFQQALKYNELFVAMSEFNDREKSDRQIIEAQNRYIMGKKQSEIEKLQAIRKQRERELAAEIKMRNTLFLVVALTLIVVGLTVYLYMVKQRSNRILEAANAQVNKQNAQLQELNATKDKFFSIISHDLKGPLNSLTSFSNLLINYYDSLSREEVQMLAKDFDKSVKNLFALLENLLEWSRSQTGNIDFTPEIFNLSGLLMENKSLLEAQAQNKKINLINQASEPLKVSAHKQSINTVIRNLISNAIKFTPEGGTIQTRAMRSGDVIVVSVADNGVGMSPAVVEKLFRIDTKITTKGTADEKGTGLGLILCKDFVEKNGGRIWVESEPGKGTVFHFSLPFLTELNKVAQVLAEQTISS